MDGTRRGERVGSGAVIAGACKQFFKGLERNLFATGADCGNGEPCFESTLWEEELPARQ